MRSHERRTIVRLVGALLVLAALGACGGDPPPVGAATWDQAVWDTATWQP
jgi:hypothetical protein